MWSNTLSRIPDESVLENFDFTSDMGLFDLPEQLPAAYTSSEDIGFSPLFGNIQFEMPSPVRQPASPLMDSSKKYPSQFPRGPGM